MLNFFINNAYAEAAAPAAAQPDAAGAGFQMVLLIGMFVVFWFLLIRPQQKRAKEHKNMVEALSKGDEIVTNGGILGKITEMDDNFIELEIATNINIKLQRNSVATLVPKGTYQSKS
jgi:preprotein translocase subunit YajC